MSKLPYMPLAVDAYLADTTHLTLEEHGAYLLLLMAMWRRNGAIPDDDKMTARMLGLMPRSWLRLKARLMPLLSVYGGTGNAPAIQNDGTGNAPAINCTRWLTQKRLQLEINRIADVRLQQSAKGKRGAEARWQQNQRPSDGRGNGTGYGRPIAPIKERKNLTTSQDLDSGEIHPLLKTPLMERTGK